MHTLSHSTGLYVHVLVEIMENLQTEIDNICPQSCNRQTASRGIERISGICMYTCLGPVVMCDLCS